MSRVAMGAVLLLFSSGCTSKVRIDYVEHAALQSCSFLSGDLATASATISSGTPYDATQTALNAFDQDGSTYATLVSSATTFIGQDFGSSPQQVRAVRLNGTVTYGFSAKLQYSDDAATWTDAGVAVDVPPGTQTSVDVTVPDVGGAHRYWRFLDSGAYAYLQIASAELFTCSTTPTACSAYTSDVATASATISSGTPYNGAQTARNAFDQNDTTYATILSSATTFIGQDFGSSPQQVQVVRLNGTVTYGFSAKLQYSDDAATWTDAGVAVDLPPGTQTSVDVPVPDVAGAHRYWRFLDSGAYAYLQIASVELLTCSTTAPACTSYTSDVATASATVASGTPYDGAQTAPNAFDQDDATYSTLVSSATTFIGQDFGGTPKEIRRVILTGTVSYGFAAKLQYSDDATTWKNSGATVDVPPFSSTPVQVDVDPAGLHRYWRFLDVGAYAYMQIGSAQMIACGTTPQPTCAGYSTNLETAAATISNGTAYDTAQDAAHAFDGDASTYATLASSMTTYLGQDFGAQPEEIRRIRLTGTVSYGFSASLQYSDDAQKWTDTNVAVDVAPMSSIAVQLDVDSFGQHRYWRFLDLGGYGYLQIASAEMFACGK